MCFQLNLLKLEPKVYDCCHDAYKIKEDDMEKFAKEKEVS